MGGKPESHWKYKPGDKIGPCGIEMLERFPAQKKAIFRCPDCGQPFSNYITAISSGTVKRCSKCSVNHKKEQIKEFHQEHKADITGQHFGKLVALYPTEWRAGNGNIVWACKCDCGNPEIIYVDVNTLKCGKKASCGCVKSRGENIIQCYLENNNINFTPQKTFDDCKNPSTNYKLRFDFYLPDYNTCIEFNGRQHYKYSKNWKQSLEEYERGRKRDNIKESYCRTKGINLLIISYKEIDKIQKILDIYLNRNEDTLKCLMN